MFSNLVMTIIGPDRPGLVESLASVISRNGGNWLESRMGHLAGQFAGILRVQVPEENATTLIEQLRALESEKLTVTVSWATETDEKTAAGPALILEVIGQDRPGIIRQLTGILARFGINVEDLETERMSAPMSGEMLFQARARVVIPKDCKVSNLRDELEESASDLMVELRLEEE